jgi:hypothetical protein
MGYNDSGRLLKHLREIEEAGEEVLSDKQEIVDLDRILCQNREAIVRAFSHLNENATLHFCAKWMDVRKLTFIQNYRFLVLVFLMQRIRLIKKT